jgi:hypothetical protein
MRSFADALPAEPDTAKCADQTAVRADQRRRSANEIIRSPPISDFGDKDIPSAGVHRVSIEQKTPVGDVACKLTFNI